MKRLAQSDRALARRTQDLWDEAGARPGDSGAPPAFEDFMRWTIDEERRGLALRLARDEFAAFGDYYRGLPAPGDHDARRRYLRGLWNREPGWACRWLMWRAGAGCGAGGEPRVLDAGCGFGTFAMLFASLGSEVVGVDLREDRIRVARTRLLHYRTQTARRLAIQYQRRSIFEESSGRFDLIWVYNALSHIDPPERFMEVARERLAPGGVLVVADINGAHSGHLQRLNAMRSDVHRHYVSPEGVEHAYAVERPFPPGELRSLARRSGLRPVHHELYYLSVIPFPVVRQVVVEPLQRCWWLGQHVGRRQLLVVTPVTNKEIAAPDPGGE